MVIEGSYGKERQGWMGLGNFPVTEGYNVTWQEGVIFFIIVVVGSLIVGAIHAWWDSRKKR